MTGPFFRPKFEKTKGNRNPGIQRLERIQALQKIHRIYRIRRIHETHEIHKNSLKFIKIH